MLIQSFIFVKLLTCQQLVRYFLAVTIKVNSAYLYFTLSFSDLLLSVSMLIFGFSFQKCVTQCLLYLLT